MAKFCSVADVKAYLNIDPARAYTGYDARIASLIELSTNEIQTFCNRSFLRGEYVEYISLPESRRNHKIWLKERAVQASPALSIKLDYSSAPSWNIVSPVLPDLYRVDAEKGVVTLMFATAHATDAAQITYTAGYPEVGGVVEVPAPVKLACALQTSANLERLLASDFGQKEKTERKGTLNTKLEDGYIKGLLPQCRNILRDYVKLRTGSRIA